MQENSPIDFFIYGQIKNFSGRILDYGCGSGRFIDFCKERSLVVDGADSFQGIYKSWSTKNSAIFRIENGVVPKQDQYYDIVISSMVLEHVSNTKAEEVARELKRLLSSNGFELHIFPTKKTLIEGHIGILGAHWLKKCPRIQNNYLKICFKLGYGYWRSDTKRGSITTKTCNDWVSDSINTLNEHCFYISVKDWKNLFEDNSLNVEDVSYLILIFAMPDFISGLLIQLSSIKVLRVLMNTLVHLRLGTALRLSNR